MFSFLRTIYFGRKMMEIVLIIVFGYIILSMILGIGCAIRLSIIKKSKKTKKNVPILEEDFIREDMRLFFSCIWIFVFIKLIIDSATKSIGGE